MTVSQLCSEAGTCRARRITGEGLCCEPDLHCGQDNGDVDCYAGQLGKIIVKESAVLIPAGHIAAQWSLREGVYLIQTTQIQLAVVEVQVDVWIDVLRI